LANPFKAFLDIRRNELPLSLLMFSYFFLVITSFWILKPIKKGLFISFYKASGFNVASWHMTASQAELLAKVLNMVVAAAAVAVFSFLANRFRRQQLTFIFCGFFALAYLLYQFVIDRPGGRTVWTFYLFGDLFATLMVATFFAFLNDSTTPDSAKRLYGLVGLGGVLGGVFGSTSVAAWIKRVPESEWLWICFGVAGAIAILAAAAGRIVDQRASSSHREMAQGPHAAASPSSPAAFSPRTEPRRANPAIEGAKLVLRSPYLLSIVGIVGFYEIVSTIMDFQFTATAEHFLSGDALKAHFPRVYAITNWISALVQFFLTSFVLTRFGVTTALLALPVAALGGSTAFLALPILATGSFLNTADNGFSYSINQSAKETLYVPTTRDEKYKAKAFIDMFVQRLAKAIAVGISLAITTIFAEFSSVRWLSLVTAAIVLVWIMAARRAGAEFRNRST
jgi:AAA family ATP:ADP antiporter